MSEQHPSATPDSVAVIIATRGRPEIVANLVRSLGSQTQRPDAIIVVATRDDDIAGLPDAPGLTTLIGRTGLTKQRNDGLKLADGRFAHIVFFDDDFVPSRFWLERVTRLFQDNPEVVSITGTVVADGNKSAGIPLDEAQRLVEMADLQTPHGILYDGFGPYGCNMSFRYSAICDMAFDERLPLYGWLEDAEFGGRLAPRGRLVRAEALSGVHLGHKTGRSRGTMLGYSQIVNAFYLARKGSLTVRFVGNLACRNLLNNLVRAMRPEPFIDRRGRLYGNLLALKDVLFGRIDPERATEV